MLIHDGVNVPQARILPFAGEFPAFDALT